MIGQHDDSRLRMMVQESVRPHREVVATRVVARSILTRRRQLRSSSVDRAPHSDSPCERPASANPRRFALVNVRRARMVKFGRAATVRANTSARPRWCVDGSRQAIETDCREAFVETPKCAEHFKLPDLFVFRRLETPRRIWRSRCEGSAQSDATFGDFE